MAHQVSVGQALGGLHPSGGSEGMAADPGTEHSEGGMFGIWGAEGVERALCWGERVCDRLGGGPGLEATGSETD